MSEARRRDAALAAVALFLFVAAASAIWTYGGTWSFLADQRREFADSAPEDRLAAAGYANGLPVDAFDFFRAHLRRKERYFLAAPENAYIAGVDRPTALRAFARYYLLPAVAVESPDEAEAVVSVGTDPATLGLPLAGVVRAGPNPFWFARIRR